LRKPVVLIIDDEELVRDLLRDLLENLGHEVWDAKTGREGMQLAARGPDLVFLDYRLPDADGFELLARIKQTDSDLPVIMLTGYSSVQHAVKAMKQGAYHYVGKPFELEEVAVLTQRALEATALQREVRALRMARGNGSSVDRIIGESPSVKRAKNLLARISQSPASTVLLTGESGTGKDLAAQVIHAHSDRASGPFLTITCSAMPETLLESELFGHERGAFTDAKTLKRGLLEHAHGGTVFLDEIGEMEPALQAKLLRFLESKTLRRVGGSNDFRADVRIIAATNVDLAEAVRERQFREDLYYRLAVLTVHIPPLRERLEDIPLLAQHFITHFNREFRKHVKRVTPGAMDMLRAHSWPGNVRELRNAIERAILLTEFDELREQDFVMLGATSIEQDSFRLPSTGVDFRELERSLVLQALERANGNKTRAAMLLGMNRDQIRYRIEKFDLEDYERPLEKRP
jgi:two-component system, NtrC family, response regulator AtoC